jgi:hypothetical protein
MLGRPDQAPDARAAACIVRMASEARRYRSSSVEAWQIMIQFRKPTSREAPPPK